MRVLHIDTELTWRGGQNQTRLLIEGQLDQGHKVFLAAPSDSAIAQTLGKYVKVLELDYHRRSLGIQAASQIAKFCHEEVIDIIDAQTSKAHHLGLISKVLGNRAHLVVHRRVDYLPTAHPLNLYKYRSKHIAAYVAISGFIAQKLFEFGISPDRIHTVKSAATPTQYNFANAQDAKQAVGANLGIDPQRTWILNAAALSKQKDHQTLITAAAHLRDKGDDFILLIAGSGPLETQLKQQANDLGLDENVVRFLGFRDDVPDLLQAADIFAISSEDEGLGTIILDAYQANCCVIATAVGGIPEIVEHERTGFLANRKDARTFADHLHKALNNPGLRQLQADLGRRKVATEFSAERMIAGNIALYEKLLEQPTR